MPSYQESEATEQVKWRGRFYDVPTMTELQHWCIDGICETPDGDEVEPDHPDSWLRIIGYV